MGCLQKIFIFRECVLKRNSITFSNTFSLFTFVFLDPIDPDGCKKCHYGHLQIPLATLLASPDRGEAPVATCRA